MKKILISILKELDRTLDFVNEESTKNKEYLEKL